MVHVIRGLLMMLQWTFENGDLWEQYWGDAVPPLVRQLASDWDKLNNHQRPRVFCCHLWQKVVIETIICQKIRSCCRWSHVYFSVVFFNLGWNCRQFQHPFLVPVNVFILWPHNILPFGPIWKITIFLGLVDTQKNNTTNSSSSNHQQIGLISWGCGGMGVIGGLPLDSHEAILLHGFSSSFH